MVVLCREVYSKSGYYDNKNRKIGLSILLLCQRVIGTGKKIQGGMFYADNK